MFILALAGDVTLPTKDIDVVMIQNLTACVGCRGHCAELVFINVVWRAQILGLDVKPVIQLNPTKSLIYKHLFNRISGGCPYSNWFQNPAKLRMPSSPHTLSP
jgi:hypothetical protein